MSLLWDASRVITLYGYWSLLKLSGHLTSSGLCGKPKYSCNESLSISSGNLIFFFLFFFSARCHRKKTSRNSTVQLSCSVAVCWTLAKPLMANWLFSWLLRLGTHRKKKKKKIEPSVCVWRNLNTNFNSISCKTWLKKKTNVNLYIFFCLISKTTWYKLNMHVSFFGGVVALV